MPTDTILLLGAGGHGKVVLDALLATGVARASVDVADDALSMQGLDFLGAPVLPPRDAQGTRFHVAVGGARALGLHHVEHRIDAVGEQRGQGACPPQVEVGVVLPGEADAAV